MSKHNVNPHERPRVVSVEKKARHANSARIAQPPRLGRELLHRDELAGGIPGYSYAARNHGPQATPTVPAQPPADYAPPPDLPPLGFIDAPTIRTAYAIAGIAALGLTFLCGLAIGAAL
jgi:hypothetical protein